MQKHLGCHMIFEGITQLQGVNKPPLLNIDAASPYSFIKNNPTLLAAMKKVANKYSLVLHI